MIEPRRPARRWPLKIVMTMIAILLALGGFAVWWYEPFRPGRAPCEPTREESPSRTRLDADQATWPRHCDRIATVLAQLGIQPVNPYVEVLHQHQHLLIEIEGRRVPVPAGIGLDQDGAPISPLHTHTPDGLLHVESPVVRGYRLVDFMTVWGVRLDQGCLGGYCTGNGAQLVIYVDGRRWSEPVNDLQFGDRQSIVILFGNTAETRADKVPVVDWSRWNV